MLCVCICIYIYTYTCFLLLLIRIEFHLDQYVPLSTNNALTAFNTTNSTQHFASMSLICSSYCGFIDSQASKCTYSNIHKKRVANLIKLFAFPSSDQDEAKMRPNVQEKDEEKLKQNDIYIIINSKTICVWVGGFGSSRS